jgi:hypothetical protein
MLPENHENAVILGVLERPSWKPTIRDLLAIYPGMKWSPRRHCIIDPEFRPTNRECSMKDFLHEATRFFEAFSSHKIGVQLSGGLDSSLIIGLLRHFKIPHQLVGMTTGRYEFRTETYIQRLLAETAEAAVMIDYEKHLPLSSLALVPAHQYPDLSSINYGADKAMAEACEEFGIEVLLTGFGGDVILGTEVPAEAAACTWKPQVFTDAWLADIAYGRHGVALIPFFGHEPIVDCFFNLRRGHMEDVEKHWARQFFREYLPRNLVEYTYRADFWGLYIDGLRAAIPAIRAIHADAGRLSGHPYFSENALDELLSEDLLDPKKLLYQKIEARTSMAVWVNSLNEAQSLTDRGQAMEQLTEQFGS